MCIPPPVQGQFNVSVSAEIFTDQSHKGKAYSEIHHLFSRDYQADHFDIVDFIAYLGRYPNNDACDIISTPVTE